MSVLILIREQREVAGLIRWGQRFAQAQDTSLQILYVKPGLQSEDCHRLPVVPDENEGDPIIQDIREVLDAERIMRQEEVDSGKIGETHKSELPGLWLAVNQNPLPVVLEHINTLNADMLLLGKTEHGKHGQQNDVGYQLIQRAHCTVMVMRPNIDADQPCNNIVVPMAGGPHSAVALRLAERVARQQKAHVVALNIQHTGTADAQAQGEFHLQKILEDAEVETSQYVEARVEVSDNIRQTINDVVAEKCDLVILGTSDHSAVSKMLFGTIDAHIMAGENATGVAVIRQARPFHSRMRIAVEKIAKQQMPPLTREERIELSERLSDGSRCSIDYVAMMFLSTAIAALGLLQNSTAVVVGAMLVAPLMTPIIGAGLGLVQGNAVLVKQAAKSISIGFLVAIAVGVIIGIISPGVVITNELLARGNPNALDLGIAFFSGIAAAYALSRPNLSAALPGVAIAAALVPPIATVGICISIGEYSNAQGAVLLFSTNVVAIIIGSAIVLHLAGIRAAESANIWANRVLQSLLLCIIILAIPLSSVFLARVTTREVKSIEQIVELQFEQLKPFDIQKVHVEEHDEHVDVRIVVISAQPVSQAFHNELTKELEESIGSPIKLEIMRLSADIVY